MMQERDWRAIQPASDPRTRRFSGTRILAISTTIIFALSGAKIFSPDAEDALAAESRSVEVKRLIAAAKAGGETELTLTGPDALVGANVKKYQALFSGMYGIDARLSYTPGPGMGDVVRMITQETAAGRKAASDVIVATESHFAALPKRNVMEEYDYTALSPRISKDMLAPQNIGVQTAALIPVIAYNTDLVPAADAPKKLIDVLNPKWKGKIGASAQSSILARIAFHPSWNPEKLKKFVASLSAQAAGLLNCGEHNRLVTGEFAMFVVNCGSYSVKSLQAKGAPLGYAIPEDAATVFFWYMGIPKTSGHPNLGKLYVNMIMSEEGQQIYHEGYAVDNFALPGSRSAAELKSIKSRGLPIVTVTTQFILQHPEINTLTTEIEEILRQKQ